MDCPSNKFFARSGLAGDEHGRGSRGDFGNPRKYHSQSRRRANNLLEHRCLADFFAERDILVSQALFGLLALFNVGASSIPAGNLSLVVAQWVITNQKPSIISVVLAESHLRLETRASRESTI